MEWPGQVSFTFADENSNLSLSPFPTNWQQPTTTTIEQAGPCLPTSRGISKSRHQRPSTPPPRSLPMPPSNTRNDEIIPVMGTKETFQRSSSETSTYNDHPSVVERFETENSIQMSDVTSAASSDVNHNALSCKQQDAMDQFLAAQLSGDPLVKEQKWKELVTAMKDVSCVGSSRSLNGRGEGRNRSSNKSWTNNDTLGFIRIAGTSISGDAGSISSGLTSPPSSPKDPKEIRHCPSPLMRKPSVDNSVSCFTGSGGLNIKKFLHPDTNGDFDSSLSNDADMSLTWENQIMDNDSAFGYGDARSRSTDTNKTGPHSGDRNELCAQKKENTKKSHEPNTSIVKKLIDRYEATNKLSFRAMDQSTNFHSTVLIESLSNDWSAKVIPTSSVVQTKMRPEPIKAFFNSQTFHKSRKTKRDSSLEEQVRNFLQQQLSHTCDDDDELDDICRPMSDLIPDEKAIPKSKSKHTKGGSVASAQEILAELRRSPTPSSSQSGKSTNSGNKPPLSISVSGTKSPQRSVSSPSPCTTIESENETSSHVGSLRPPASPRQLAPSRRDILRVNRVNRKCASEPALASNPDDIISNDDFLVTKIESSTGDFPQISEGLILSRPRVRVFPCTSPLMFGSEGHIITTPEKVKEATSLPHITPRPAWNNLSESPIAQKQPVSQNSFQVASHRSRSSKPSRMGLTPSKRDVRSVSCTRRVVPSVKDIAARMNGQTKSGYSNLSIDSVSVPLKLEYFTDKNTSKSVASAGSKERIDELRASISKLKHNGVGGIGKATSTLVRNEETGRYVIRDVDDESFDDIVLADMMRPDQVNEQRESESVASDKVEDPPCDEESTVFRLLNASNETSLSDKTVDDAVRAALESISLSTSTDEGFKSPNYPAQVSNAHCEKSTIAEDDDALIVSSHMNNWATFQPSINNKSYPFVENTFDVNLFDQWDDDDTFSCKRWEDGNNAWNFPMKGGSANDFSGKVSRCFRSPTSVAAPNRKKISEHSSGRREDGHDLWDPFAM